MQISDIIAFFDTTALFGNNDDYQGWINRRVVSANKPLTMSKQREHVNRRVVTIVLVSRAVSERVFDCDWSREFAIKVYVLRLNQNAVNRKIC